MSKEDFVELTIRIPKRLLDILEQENYLGWSREEFWEAAVESRIAVETSGMIASEELRLRAKYGDDFGVFYLKHES